MASLKRVMGDMVEKDMIYMKGKKGSESFYVRRISGEDSQETENKKLENINMLERSINDLIKSS